MPTYTNTLRLNDNIISVRSIPPSQFSTVRAYEYVSKGLAPNVINQRDRLQTPDGTDLVEDAIFFEAEVDNSTNPPTFRQQVINAVLANNEIKIHEYNTVVPFTYPGIVDTQKTERVDGSHREGTISLEMHAPVQTEVEATVFEFLQISNDLADSDFSFDGSSGYWKPNQWASIKALGTNNEVTNVTRNSTFLTFQDFRGFRLADNFGETTSFRDIIRFNASTVMRQYDESCTLTVSAVDQGPPNPIGFKWVLDIDLQPAFISSDGTTYYKKSIIVSEVIPIQSDSTVPYS